MADLHESTLDKVTDDVWEQRTEAGIASGDLERLPNGRVRMTAQGRTNFKAKQKD